MKFAFSSNAYRRWSIEEAIARISDLGFRGFELMADEPHAWPVSMTPERIHALREVIGENSLVVSNVNAFMMCAVQDFWHPSWIERDEDFRRLRLQHTIDALRMARDLDAKCISTEPGGPLPEDMSRDEAMEVFAAGLHAALIVAEEVEVKLLVEPEPDLLIENSDQFLELASRVDSPMFGLNFDVGHFYCVGEPLPESIERMKGFTGHYHIEDIAATRVHQHLIPGHGAIDFAEVLGAIEETGYEDWVTIELYPYLDNPDAAGLEALRHLNGQLRHWATK